MTSGIYLYYDVKKNYVVYVGKDSNIDKKTRHKYHMAKCNYGKQSVNRVLQNNPDRYKYVVFCKGDFLNEELNDLEIQAIKLFNTFYREDAFNYTEGGDGIVGKKHSEETRKKISDANSGENNHMYGKKHSEETRKKISEAISGEKHHMYGKKIPDETRKKMSEAHKKNYVRVIKKGFTPSEKQNYALKYNGKTIKRSINKEKLEELADKINKLKNKDEEIIKKIIEEYNANKKNLPINSV